MVNGFQSVPDPARDPVFLCVLGQGQLPAEYADIAEENIILFSLSACLSRLLRGACRRPLFNCHICFRRA
jgi:hypothetical protein